MRDGILITALSLLPKNQTARWMGRLARLRLPGPLLRPLLRLYARLYQVDLTEAPPLDTYPTFSAFFTRPLLPDRRTIDAAPDILVSPVDGTVHTFGTIQGGTFAQSDLRTGHIADLLGSGDARLPDGAPPPLHLDRYEGGHYAVIYLSPRDYHRVHTPCQATLGRCRYLPGRLWPVFPAATRAVERLFDHNERLIFQLEAPQGGVVLAMIGALGVGRMYTAHADGIVTNTRQTAGDRALSVPLERGAELGIFDMGSTVIILVEPGHRPFSWSLTPGAAVRLGTRIGGWA